MHDLTPRNAPGAQHATASERASPWVAITAIVLVAIDLRPGIVSIGPVLPAIREHFALTHSVAALMTTIPDFLMGLLALPTPSLARRFGRDRVVIAALSLLLVSMAARAFAPNALILLLATAGVGAGIAIAGTLIAGFIKASFPTKAALLMGIYAMALSTGSTASAALTGPVAAGAFGGWREAIGMWALLGVIAIPAWLVVARGAHRAPSLPAAKVALPVRNGTAWRVALYFAFDNFLFYAFVSWTASIYREAGFSTSKAGLVLATFTAAFTVATFAFGWRSKSEDRRFWLLLCGLLTTAGIVSLALAPMAAPFVSVSVAALGLGGGFSLGMTLPLDNTDSVESANTWTAFVLTVGYLIAAFGPLSVGALRDASSSFGSSLWLMCAVSAGMVALAPFLQPHRSRGVGSQAGR
ncbi:CynX/NimT family MFS transporter [Beijerinckia sp. L45]|uniref:MFS transporter n=1 Tax=Beijerinckia sp. L45 TaxID=1641855 RepID=UPI001577255B|nr:MFS transporter [Beijerinckia sp. L45]